MQENCDEVKFVVNELKNLINESKDEIYKLFANYYCCWLEIGYLKQLRNIKDIKSKNFLNKIYNFLSYKYHKSIITNKIKKLIRQNNSR